MSKLLCGNASDNLYLTFKGGCRGLLELQDCYRCTGCGGRFHKDCILEHFKLEESHDWGRQQEREELLTHLYAASEIRQAITTVFHRKTAPKYVKIIMEDIDEELTKIKNAKLKP